MPGDGENKNTQTPAGTDSVVQPGSQTNGGEGVQNTPEPNQPTNQRWMSQLPDELKGNADLAKYSSLGEAIKALMDGNKSPDAEGGNGSQENPPVENYTFTKTFVTEADPDGSLTKGLTETFKSLKLDQAKAEEIFNTLVDYQNTNIETFKTKGKELCETALKDAWGEKYDAKLAAMKRAYDKLVPEGSEMDKGLDMTGSKNNPFVAQLLAEIGESIGEHNPPPGSSVGANKPTSTGFLSRENEIYPW